MNLQNDYFEAQTTQQMESVMGMINEFDTIAAIATAVSNAGIGIIRISGSEAMTILSNILNHITKSGCASVRESSHLLWKY